MNNMKKLFFFLVFFIPVSLLAMNSEKPSQLRMRKTEKQVTWQGNELKKLKKNKDKSCLLSCCYVTGQVSGYLTGCCIRHSKKHPECTALFCCICSLATASELIKLLWD